MLRFRSGIHLRSDKYGCCDYAQHDRWLGPSDKVTHLREEEAGPQEPSLWSPLWSPATGGSGTTGTVPLVPSHSND